MLEKKQNYVFSSMTGMFFKHNPQLLKNSSVEKSISGLDILVMLLDITSAAIKYLYIKYRRYKKIIKF